MNTRTSRRRFLKNAGLAGAGLASSAVFALPGQDDLLMIVKRVEALSKFLGSDDGKNLLAGVKRATNILKIEEKKEGKTYGTDIEPLRLLKPEEKGLHSAITIASARRRPCSISRSTGT